MTLLEKINRLNLKPRNAPAGVKTSTFGEWLRKLRSGQDIGEIPTALLGLYCHNLMNGPGLAENFSDPRRNSLSKEFIQRMRGEFVKDVEPELPPNPLHVLTEEEASAMVDHGMRKWVKLDEVKKSPVRTTLPLNVPTPDGGTQKIPAKTHISLNPTGFPSWGADKTYKFVGSMLKVNFDGKGYNALGVTKLGDSFIIEGIPYPVSEFTKVG